MREAYTPEISIQFSQDRVETLDEERAGKRKKKVEACPNFINAIQGYTKQPCDEIIKRQRKMNNGK